MNWFRLYYKEALTTERKWGRCFDEVKVLLLFCQSQETVNTIENIKQTWTKEVSWMFWLLVWIEQHSSGEKKIQKALNDNSYPWTIQVMRTYLLGLYSQSINKELSWGDKDISLIVNESCWLPGCYDHKVPEGKEFESTRNSHLTG